MQMFLKASTALESTLDNSEKVGVSNEVAIPTSKGLWSSSMKASGFSRIKAPTPLFTFVYFRKNQQITKFHFQ